jgi:hypothetical protein
VNIDPETRINRPIARKKTVSTSSDLESPSASVGADGLPTPSPLVSVAAAAIPGEDWMDRAKREEQEKVRCFVWCDIP